MFKLGPITAYNDDYRNILPLYPDGYFDLCYDDPEWGIGADNPTMKPCKVRQSNGTVLAVAQPGYPKKEWDSKPVDDSYFEAVKAKSKHQIIWGENFFDFSPAGGRIIWNKLNGESDQFDAELAYCSLHNRIDVVYYMWAGMFQGTYCGRNLSKALIQQGNKKLNEKRRHPTQKPLKLGMYMLNTYARKDWKILITHGGSMNDAIACYKLGLECVICEIDKDYFNDGNKELKRQASQQVIEF